MFARRARSLAASRLLAALPAHTAVVAMSATSFGRSFSGLASFSSSVSAAFAPSRVSSRARLSMACACRLATSSVPSCLGEGEAAGGASLDSLRDEVDRVQSLFAMAREEIEEAQEDIGTTYFDAQYHEAHRTTKQCLDGERCRAVE